LDKNRRIIQHFSFVSGVLVADPSFGYHISAHFRPFGIETLWEISMDQAPTGS